MSTRAPGGSPPPTVCWLNGLNIDLVPLADEICRRYHVEFADEFDRYGPAAGDWCRHDNQWLLSWAIADLQDVTNLNEQACWLARVLHNRGFPTERLVFNLRLAADVVRDGAAGDSSAAVAERLDRAAGCVGDLELE